MSDAVKAIITWGDMEESKQAPSGIYTTVSTSVSDMMSRGVATSYIMHPLGRVPSTPMPHAVDSDLVEYLDVSYSPSAPPNTFHTFDIHVPMHLVDDPLHQPDTPGLICFIHGGAWRA